MKNASDQLFQDFTYWAQTLLSESENALWWSQSESQAYRDFILKMPWQVGVLDFEPNLRIATIERLLKNPNDFFAHAVLGLFKRRFKFPSNITISQQIQALFEWQDQFLGKYLTVLPAVQDFKITVVMITYNRLPLFKRAVQAIREQTNPNWKMIILDHGSTDGTTHFCRQIEAEEPEKIKVLYREINSGIEALGQHYHSLFEAVETELVLYQSDDDWLLPNHLEAIAQLYKRYPWIAMASGGYTMVNEVGEASLIYGPFYSQPNLVSNQKELQRAFVAGVCPQASVFRKSILKELGPFDFLFFSKDNDYAVWDYLVTVKHLGSFEVAYDNQEIARFYSSEQTAYAQTDFTQSLLKLMALLQQDYQSLFGAGTFPRTIMQGFLNGLVLGRLIGSRLKAVLAEVPDLEKLGFEIDKLMPGWETYLAHKTQLLLETDSAAPILISLTQPYRDDFIGE
jgi:glycosyltransferase involved in cell wall biosynthesis